MTGLTYFKRYRMELDLQPDLPRPGELPDGYFLLPWDDGLIARHAEVKHAAFREEMDSAVFPSFLSFEGCMKLMESIRYRAGFLPGATWLLAHGIDYVGTVQGVRDAHGVGAVQNLGVIDSHRGRGLGLTLLLHALHGFRTAGVHKAMLEVTAKNDAAILMYRRLGFLCRRTVYKPIDPSAAPVAQVAEFAAVR